jgi:hypothetical protein
MLPTIEELERDLSGQEADPEETSMVLSNLKKLESMARELQELVKQHGGVPEWSQEKIAVCASDLDAVHQNMKFNPEPLHEATVELQEGSQVLACAGCLLETLAESHGQKLVEAEYKGRKVPLNKPMQGDVKKFKVYVKDPKTGNVKKVNFGDPDMKIKKSNPERRKSFRARHNCDSPGPKTKARYWSCRKW